MSRLIMRTPNNGVSMQLTAEDFTRLANILRCGYHKAKCEWGPEANALREFIVDFERTPPAGSH